MTDQEINIAIAKACGWEPLPEGYFHPDNPIGQRPPNYCHDLNAMHEALVVLNGPKLWIMYNELLGVMNRTEHLKDWCVFRCSARQRAEAFLRVKGLWKE